MKNLNRYALLIGIDCYLPNKLPDGSSYSSLAGCVRDITQVEEFLQSNLGMPKECILKLTASNTGTTEPPELCEQWPTYENMVAAFRQLSDMAQPGDQVYIHYSGHGGRTPTWFPELKGANGLDESLVPTDIGNQEARYLRDIELAHILQKIVDKGLIITIVLDSCHSGSATRSGGAVVRGLPSDTVDTTARPKQSLVASDDELVATWRSLTEKTTRHLKLGSGWLPEPKGYVLLAACGASESAYEYAFDGEGRNGALTYWLLNSLKQSGIDLTYKLLHDRIVAKVHSQFKHQTPQLQGEGDRVIFGSDRIQPHYAVNVIQIDLVKQRVLLNTGQSQAVRTGTRFAIYPPGVTDFTLIDQRLALVEITDIGATNSWATITDTLRSDPIDSGSQAVLLDPGTMRLRSTVRLVHQDILSPTVDQHTALEKVKQALAQDKSGFIILADEDISVDYQVAVNALGEYEIWDSGGQPIPNMCPALRIDEDGAAVRVAQRLVHLTKYHNIQLLDNVDDLSPLAGKLLVELVRAQPDYEPGDRPKPQPLHDPGNTPTLKVGEWIFVRVRNNSSQILNITVLGLQPDWSIIQLYPSSQDTYYMSFDPGQEYLLPLQANLPFGYTGGTDVIKVLATVGFTNFRWLELPSLDQPPTQNANFQRRPTNPLEDLLAAMVAEKLDTRHFNSIAFPNWEWATAQVEVRIQSAKPEQI
ncbi:MAG: caspase family protein [Cyanobacteriota bacterium]